LMADLIVQWRRAFDLEAIRWTCSRMSPGR
jgi:hypothetical protein